jgi:membrane protease YdiL (CAAX protease family)
MLLLAFLALVVLATLHNVAEAFSLSKRSSGLLVSQKTPLASTRIRRMPAPTMVTAPLDKDEKKAVTLREVFTPKTLNSFGIFWTIAGDVFLLNLGFFLAFIFDVDLTQAATSFFDLGVLSDCLYISAFLTLAGFLFDKIPNVHAVTEIVSDTRFYALRLLGRNTSPIKALSVAAVLSFAAGFCEELFFRGFLLAGLMQLNLGAFAATLISALVFGLSHSPRWGSSAVIETFLGIVFGITFTMTGFNLAYPVLVHFFYDLVTLFFTWLDASRDLRTRMKRATEDQLISLDTQDTRTFDALIRATFDLLDTNGDNAISPKELERGLKWFGIAQAHPFDRGQKTVLLINNPELTNGEEELTVAELFDRCDNNNDGKLQYFEFRELMSGGLFSWPTDSEWARSEGAL